MSVTTSGPEMFELAERLYPLGRSLTGDGVRETLRELGKHVPLEELRVACGVTRDGVKASNLVKAARRYGLDAHGLRFELETLEKLPTPAIMYWQFNHFVVYEGRSAGGYRLNDPASGHRVVSAEEFDRSFTGVVIAVAPGHDFVRSGAPFSFVDTCRRWTHHGRASRTPASRARRSACAPRRRPRPSGARGSPRRDRPATLPRPAT